MSIATGPKPIINGLVFSYDSANTQKSWRGAPTTNLYADGDFSSLALHPVRSGTWQIVPDPRNSAKTVLKATASGSNQYHGRDITVTVSTVYSLQMEVFVSEDFNGSNVQMYPEQGGAGASVAYDLSKKSTWQTLKFDGKSATTTNIRMLAYALSAFTTGYILISNVQVEQKAFATPFVNGTRSNTQAVLDVTNTRVITANSLNYLSDNTFEFDGTSGNQLTFPYTQTQPNNFSVLAWIYQRSYSTDTNIGDIIVMPYGNYNAWIFSVVGTGSKLELRHHNFGASNTSYNVIYNTDLNLNTWYHVGATDDGTNVRLYVNGVNVVTSTSAVSTTNGTMTCQVGAWGGAGTGTYFDGKIPMVQIYSRALTAGEITQNFSALRGRFGI